MELYLNQIYLGEGTYGIAAASLEYFDKAVRDLNYEEYKRKIKGSISIECFLWS